MIIIVRTIPWPRNFRSSRSAMHKPRNSEMMTTAAVSSTVTQMALRAPGSVSTVL